MRDCYCYCLLFTVAVTDLGSIPGIKLEAFYYRELQEKYVTLCDFVTVYVEEAHPLEKHHFAGNIPLLTHQTIQVSTGLNENDFSIFAKFSMLLREKESANIGKQQCLCQPSVKPYNFTSFAIYYLSYMKSTQGWAKLV